MFCCTTAVREIVTFYCEGPRLLAWQFLGHSQKNLGIPGLNRGVLFFFKQRDHQSSSHSCRDMSAKTDPQHPETYDPFIDTRRFGLHTVCKTKMTSFLWMSCIFCVKYEKAFKVFTTDLIHHLCTKDLSIHLKDFWLNILDNIDSIKTKPTQHNFFP